MLFILGFSSGMVLCTFLFAVMAVLRPQQIVERAEANIRNRAREVNERLPDRVKIPISQGFVYTPPDEDEEARQEIIEENRRQGRPTRISELQS